MIQSIDHDVIVVGGGGAGLRAAIAVAMEHPELDVALISKVYPMRSHTVTAEGGAAGVSKAEDSFDFHMFDTVAGGDWLVDQEAVEMFVHECPKELTQLEHWGLPWSRTPEGKIAVRAFGGMKIERTWYASDKIGFHILHTLFQTSLKFPKIKRYDEFFATKLLVEDGRAQGVTAIDQKTGELHLFSGKSVCITTGGCGRVFPFSTNGAIKTGDGMAMAYRAGIPMKDMEFIQYHPTGLPFTGLLITEAVRGEGGILLNKDGYRYLQDYDLGEPVDVNDARHPIKKNMELGPRDRLSQAFMHERKKGNTIPGPHGDYVNLDITHLGEKKINERLPFARALALNYVGIDPVYEPIPVRPVVHYMMGGVDTDKNAATIMPGVFSAGETACVSINGANRLGSNSLPELLVFGALAGRGAAEFAKEHSDLDMNAIEAQYTDEKKRIEEKFLTKTDGKERISKIRNEMRDIMEEHVGVYREGKALQTSYDELCKLRDRFSDVAIGDHSKTFNTELIEAIELDHMLDVSLCITQSALQRKESRGAHQRTDYTERDDENFLKSALAFQGDDGLPRIEYRDVVVTKIPPAARVYGVDKEEGKKEEGEKA